MENTKLITMEHSQLHSGFTMERINAMLTPVINLSAWAIAFVTWADGLRNVSYIVAILWTVGQMIINRKKFINAIKELFKRSK